MHLLGQAATESGARYTTDAQPDADTAVTRISDSTTALRISKVEAVSVRIILAPSVARANVQRFGRERRLSTRSDPERVGC